MRKQFTPEEQRMRAYLRMAQALHSHREEGSHADTGLFDVLIGTRARRRAYLLLGASRNGATYCEHVVPRKRLRKDCFELFDQNKTIEDVADYLERNLKTVLISADEAKFLNSMMGLKDNMPDGWKDGDEIMVRLSGARIEIVPCST
jgi:hypothetical protein